MPQITWSFLARGMGIFNQLENKKNAGLIYSVPRFLKNPSFYDSTVAWAASSD